MGNQSSRFQLLQQLTGTESEDENSTSVAGFPQFSKLPAEIRLKIIRYATNDLPPECCRTIWLYIDQDRQLQIRRSGVEPPAVFFVNHEFRHEALRRQIVLAGKRINPYCDILQLPRGRGDTPTPLKPLEEIVSQIPRPIRQVAMLVSYWDEGDDLLGALEIRRLLPDLEVLNVMLIRARGVPQTVDVWQHQYMLATYVIPLAHPENAFVPGFTRVVDEDWAPRLKFAVYDRIGKRGRIIERMF